MKPLSLLSATAALALSAIHPLQAETFSAEKTGSIYQAYGSVSQNPLYVANAAPSPNHTHQWEAYVAFDLSSFVTGTTITSATLELRTSSVAAGFLIGFGGYTYASLSGQSFSFSVAAADSDYNTLTWAGRPTSSGPVSQGIFTYTPDGNDDYVSYWLSVDVTSIVQNWIDNPEDNFGFHLYVGSPTFTGVAFEGGNGAFGPKLTVVPEPSTWAFIAFGVGGLVLYSRRAGRRSAAAA